MLKVTVAEVERDIVKQLGINLSGTLGYGTAVVNFNNTNPFSAYGQSLSGSAINGSWKNITATLQAMEQAGVVHLLAEPNLTAISGETATFVAGGQFPILNGYSCSATSNTPGAPTTCQPSISFKNFGVSLNFTPVVLSAGRISLKVLTEVLGPVQQPTRWSLPSPARQRRRPFPSIRTRRADTTVEIPSGGSLAMAGMIQDETRHNINGFPGLMELPILGPLFKSNDYVNQRTELMILVTPYIVRSVRREGSVAARRRLRRSQRSGAGAARQFQSPLRRRWQDRTAARQLPRQVRLHPRLMQDIWRLPMHRVRTLDRRSPRRLRLALRTVFAVGFAALVCGCKTDQQITAAPDVPADYRLRHPISITEKDHTLQLFIGANRGSLMPVQRAELLAFGQTWRDQATGGVIVDLPVGSSNEHSAADSLREIESILAATGVPPQSIAVRNYRVSPRVLATVRITLSADRRPSRALRYHGRRTSGRASIATISKISPIGISAAPTQRNLAAMVAEPADLVQPRAETSIYAQRRTTVMEKYRLGQPTATSRK